VSVVRQSSVILALGWLLTPLQFLTSAAVARAVGPEGRGVLYLLAGVTALLTVVTSFGATAAVAVVYRQRKHPPGAILGAILTLALGSALLVILAYLSLSQLFVDLFLGRSLTVPVDRLWIVLALTIVPLTTLTDVGDVLLIGEDAMKTFALRSSGTALAAITLTWLLAFVLKLGVTGVLLAQALSLLFGLGVFGWWFLRRHGLRQLGCSWAVVRDLLRVGLQQLGVSLIGFVSKRFDAFIIARLLTLRDAGYYAVAGSIQTLFVNIPRSTVWPMVFKLGGDDPRRHEVLAQSTRLLMLVVGLGSLLFLAVAPVAVVLIFGAPFAPAVAPVCWALLGVFVTPIIVGTNALHTSRGRPARMIVASLPAAAVQVGLNFLLVPWLGASGSAIALSANYLTTAAIQLVQLGRDPEAPPLRAMLIPTRQDLAAVRAAIAARLSRRRAGAAAPVDKA
jgi:O-antigen/teichoic acid export membrane protein